MLGAKKMSELTFTATESSSPALRDSDFWGLERLGLRACDLVTNVILYRAMSRTFLDSTPARQGCLWR